MGYAFQPCVAQVVLTVHDCAMWLAASVLGNQESFVGSQCRQQWLLIRSTQYPFAVFECVQLSWAEDTILMVVETDHDDHPLPAMIGQKRHSGFLRKCGKIIKLFDTPH